MNLTNLKKRVLTGSFWSLASNGGEQLIRLTLFVYVARRLTPADVGLVVLAMVFIDVLAHAARLGQAEAIQRQSSLDDRLTSTSFWLLVTGGLLVSGLVALGTGVAIKWWDIDLFGIVLLMLSPICALRAWTAAPEAILRHRFSYRSLAIRSWLATLIGGGTAAVLAYLGFGFYALVAQRLVSAVIGLVTSWALLGWRPNFEFDRSTAKQLLRTGVVYMTSGFAGQVNRNLVNAITGFGLSPTQLGLFRIGGRFFEFVTKTAVQPISRVSLSTFSQLQHDVEALKRALLRLSQFMALASLPMFVGLGIVADVFVPIVLGPKWAGSVIVMQFFAFSRLTAPIGYFFGPTMVAMGRTRALFRHSIVQISLTVVLVSIGTFFGIVGVLAAFITRGVLITIYNIVVFRKEIGLEPIALLGVLIPPAVGCAVMAAVVEFAKLELAGEFTPVVLLALLVVIGAISYGATLLIGEVIHLWPGYIRGAASSLSRAVRRRPKVAATPA